jgi:uncharacterized protein YjeT (DUF2065 family)
MSAHLGTVLLRVLVGLLVGVGGALIARYPEASYAVRTAWKHDDVSLSEAGRRDQRLMGTVIVAVGVGVALSGLFAL